MNGGWASINALKSMAELEDRDSAMRTLSLLRPRVSKQLDRVKTIIHTKRRQQFISFCSVQSATQERNLTTKSKVRGTSSKHTVDEYGTGGGAE